MAATAYSYVSLSSRQHSGGDGRRRQVEAREAWLSRNNVRLDMSLSLQDEGLSDGSPATHSDTAVLVLILRLVQEGRIPKGSYLIIECLDRLSREQVKEALRLLLTLAAAGIRIVQLLP